MSDDDHPEELGEWVSWACVECGAEHADPEFIITHCSRCGLVVIVYNRCPVSEGWYIDAEYLV